MIYEVSVGAIDPVDFSKLGPSDDTRDEKIHNLLCPSLYMRPIVERICV